MSSRDREGEVAEQGEGKLGREVLVVFALSVVATGALALGGALWGWLSPYVSLLVALVFLGLPTWWVQRRRGEAPEEAGMRYGPWGRGVAWGLCWAAVVFAPFALGFHVWATQVQGREASWGWDNYARWPLELEGRPPGLEEGEPGFYVWSEGRALRIWWRGAEGAVEARLEAEGGALEVTRLDGARMRTRGEGGEGGAVWVRGAGGGGVALEVREGGAVRLELREGGAELAAERVRMGASGEAAAGMPLELEQGVWWLVMVVLTQLLFVGLPEEYFYRGYVQPTLDRVYGEEAGWGRGRWRLRRSVVVASALFALGHVLIEPSAGRLAVFFPSLLFGQLRVWTGGLVAPVVFHALCNTMVEVVAVHYG